MRLSWSAWMWRGREARDSGSHIRHPFGVIVREGGRSSIPETVAFTREASGILDAPLSRGMTAEKTQSSNPRWAAVGRDSDVLPPRHDGQNTCAPAQKSCALSSPARENIYLSEIKKL